MNANIQLAATILICAVFLTQLIGYVGVSPNPNAHTKCSTLNISYHDHLGEPLVYECPPDWMIREVLPK
jgi:hypothetical protein